MAERVPRAKCTRCGHSWVYGNPLRGVRRGLFEGSTTNCPKCDGVAVIEDFAVDDQGKLHFLAEAYDLLREQATDEQLEQLREAAEAARVLPRAEATDRLVAAFPPLSELLIPKDASDFYSLVGLLLMLILWMIGSRERPKELPPTVINNVIVNAPARPRRNDPCPCGSGKKYKKCHGAGK